MASLNNDSARGRGLRTGIQAALAALLTFIIGLIMAVWKVPGVPVAVVDYVQGHLIEVLLAIGIPSGLVSWVWNILRKGVPNK